MTGEPARLYYWAWQWLIWYARLTWYSGKNTMPKALCISGMVVGGLLLVLFGLDLALGLPFERSSVLLDIMLVICGAMLAGVSFQTFREQA